MVLAYLVTKALF